MDQQTGGKRQRRKVILTNVFDVLPSAVCMNIYRGCMPASMAHLKQSSPVPATLTRALLARIHRGNGMCALPRKGSSCHNVNWRSWKWENTHPDPLNSNTSMKLSSCRLTSSSGGAASSAYRAIISEVRVTGGCVTTLGSTALWQTIVMAT